MSTPTAQQQEAIQAVGAVLLAAGAGTGKTATLVSRCLRLVTEGGVDVDRLLVVTFTNAAAAEMKQRLREALRARAAESPQDGRLQRQPLLLESAPISTIHSFCLELVRSHFAELGLDPGVTVLDDAVTLPLARRLAREVVVESLTEGDETSTLLERYAPGAGQGLEDLLLAAHRFFVAQPAADLLLAREIERFTSADSEGWRACRGRVLAEWFAEQSVGIAASVEAALGILPGLRGYSGKGKIAEGARRVEAGLPGLVERVRTLARATDEETLSVGLTEVCRWGGKDVWVHGIGKARRPLDDFFEEATWLLSRLPVDGVDPLDREWRLVRGSMQRLLELTRRFSERFAAAKRALGGVDFSDLEQLALGLLRDGEGRPTPIAIAWRERLEHVFVDECQDINAAQEALLRAVAREGERSNLFMVGDVKQSIYRFRMAAPELFRHHAETWPLLAHHRVLPLTENFRSREGVLAFANALFSTLMEPRLGGVGYGPEDRLAFGAPSARTALSLQPSEATRPAGVWSEPDCRVELHLVDTRQDPGPEAGDGGEASAPEGSGEGWGDLLDLERQANVIGGRLLELHRDGHSVWDKGTGGFRPLRWGDIGLLMRSVRGRAPSFLRVFRRLGIPLVVEQGDFLATLEASDLAALLRILDNPRQDIALFAVLRSPLAGWSLEDLVALAAGTGPSGGWDRLESLAQGADEGLEGQARHFVASLHRWRRLALMTSLTAVLETILAETRYEAYLLTLPDGPDRVANTRRFLDLARRFDPLQRQGLFRFLRFLDEQQDAGRELDPLPPRQAEAVQMLSIHKSKGLEFPVVVLAGMGARFQHREARESLLFSRCWGVAPQVVDLTTRSRGDSLVSWWAKREERAASLAEELRLLYVAITRARDTLLLVGSFNPASDSWQNRVAMPPVHGVPKAGSYVGWIGLWLGSGMDWSAGAGEVAIPSGTSTARLRWRVHSQAVDPGLPGADDALRKGIPGGASGPPVGNALAWRYPYEPATTLPAKTSATALRRLEGRGDMTPSEEAVAPWSVRRVFRPAHPRTDLPTPSGRPGRLSATAVGTAHHRFLQHLSLEEAGDEAGLVRELERLRAAGGLRPDEVEAVDPAAIQGFWASPLGAEIRSHAAGVRRELAFTAGFSPSELPPLAPRFQGSAEGELVVVQGAVDLAVIHPHEIWVVDFKTDRIDESGLVARAGEHERQLRLYAAALERVYGRPVTRCVLYFLALRRLWDVALERGRIPEGGSR